MITMTYRILDLGECDYCGEDVELPCLVKVFDEADDLDAAVINCPTCGAEGLLHTNWIEFWAHWY